MELQGYLLILRARWRVVVTVTLLSLVLALAYSFTVTPKYTAHASVFLSASLGQNTSELSRSFLYAQGLVRSTAQVATEPVVLAPVISQLGLNTTPALLANEITAQAPLDTVIVDIKVTDTSGQRAADIANAVAEQLSTAVGGVVPGTSKDIPVKVTLLTPAIIPSYAASPAKKLNLGIALVVGLLLGAVLAISRDALDARVRGPLDAISLTSVPVIGSVVVQAKGRRRLRLALLLRLVLRLRSALPWRQRSGSTLELDKQLRTIFQYMRSQRSLKTVVFASALLDSSTSIIMSNLATDLGEAGLNVLIIDADARRPTLAARHGVSDSLGLSSVLTGDTSVPSVIMRSAISPVWVLPAGPELADPSLMMDDVALKDVVTQLADPFEVVLIKAPPVLRIADGLTLARICDGVVIVADEPAMNRNVLSEEMSAFEVAGADVLGIVLTRHS